ncbi:DUF3604 domain-containing protein [bacterium]|nr:DUF3604 domain-containing protein [bacterium]
MPGADRGGSLGDPDPGRPCDSGGARTRRIRGAAVILLSLLVAACDSTSSAPVAPPTVDGTRGAPWRRTETREPCAGFDLLRRPFFGDLHVHTRYSADASIYGTKTGPSDAYAYARGEEIPFSDDDEQPTRRARIDRPLDFAAVTDHAEFFGEVDLCLREDSGVHDLPMCRDLRAPDDPNDRFATIVEWLFPAGIPNPPASHGFCATPGIDCDAAAASVWREIQAAAEEAYDRTDACTFTSFVGYEHTASLVGRHQHRNVIFRNEHVPTFASSQLETATEGIPQGLWNAVERDCLGAGSGCDAVVIPHNPNLSGGRQFEDPLGPEDAARREMREPLVEIHQVKSSSECRFDRVAGTGVGTEDERCAFEQRPNAHEGPDEPPPATADYPARNLVRNALKDGLALEAALGANPFRMGFVGSTDSHDAAPGSTAERDWPGAMGNSDSSPARRIENQVRDNPGGLAVAWAEENSRDAIFSAMRRREVYGTSGTRPILRFFGGAEPDLRCGDPRFVEKAYRGGMPMGAEIGPVSGRRSPRFGVLAFRDPGSEGAPGARLQRLQIVKGWVDRDGGSHEKVFDVAGGDDGGSVDTRTCEPSGAGADSLCAVWSDPGFDASERAFYYARVVEEPTCRWSTWLCNEQGVDCSDPAKVPAELAECCVMPKTIQERAWSSPIWFRPEGVASLVAEIAPAAGGGRGLVGVIGGHSLPGSGGGGLHQVSGRGGPTDGRGDVLRLRMELGAMPPGFDPETQDVVVSLRDDDVILQETIPAGRLIPGGATTGLARAALVRRSDGRAVLEIETLPRDLRAADRVDHFVEVEVRFGAHPVSIVPLWRWDGRRLGTGA